jgi:RNA polymerase sigma-70 factor, ECF subfamily
MAQPVDRRDPGPSDEALLVRARSGDERAFAAIVTRHEPRVAATAIGMLGPGNEAEDVGQETFIRLYRSLDRFRGDASLGTYLTRIAMNLSLTALRRRKSWYAHFVPAGAGPEGREADGRTAAGPRIEAIAAEGTRDALASLETEERAVRVRRALDELKPEHRAVVVLRWMEGLSTRDTAKALGVPEGTVMSRLYRAMDRLGTALEGDDA